MSEIKVVDADQLDLNAYVALQREAFATVLTKNGVSSDYLTPAFFSWKYSTPAGKGRIAVVYEGGKLVAANAIMPYLVSSEGRVVKAWQSCDTAATPSARGKGYFKGCLKSLLTVIQDDEIFYGFPNQNSVRGFHGIGWRQFDTMSTFVQPKILHFLKPRKKNPAIHQSPDFPDGYAAFSRTWMASRAHETVAVVRDLNYMRWRYSSHPERLYTVFYHELDGKTRGVAVCRHAHVKGKRIALIMELLCENGAAQSALRRSVEAWAYSEGAQMIIDLNNHQSASEALPAGFIKVPSFLLPKKQVFMGSAVGSEARSTLSKRWYLNLGDWDGF